MNETAKRVYVFDVVSAKVYHAALFNTWLHLVTDGLVSKNDDLIFGEIGNRFVNHICRTLQMPDYQVVIGWIPELYNQ